MNVLDAKPSFSFFHIDSSVVCIVYEMTLYVLL